MTITIGAEILDGLVSGGASRSARIGDHAAVVESGCWVALCVQGEETGSRSALATTAGIMGRGCRQQRRLTLQPVQPPAERIMAPQMTIAAKSITYGPGNTAGSGQIDNSNGYINFPMHRRRIPLLPECINEISRVHLTDPVPRIRRQITDAARHRKLDDLIR